MNIFNDKRVKPNYDSYVKFKISQFVEKLQSIRKSRISVFYTDNPDQLLRKIKKVPESILGSYLAPKFIKKPKVKTLPPTKHDTTNPDKGPLNYIAKQKTLITSISQGNILKTPSFQTPFREYINIQPSNKTTLSVYDPYANNSLMRKHLYRNCSIPDIHKNSI
jgi:hypothetical protein